MEKIPTVCIVGSINMDLTIRTDSIPIQGETVLGSDFATYPGGKGANQAVAAARMGAHVNLIGAVGDDSFGKSMLAHLQAEGIHTEGVTTVSDETTGVANIILSEADNRIIVAPGANDFVLPELVDQYEENIKKSDIVLLQLEIPIHTVLYVLDVANKYKIPVIVNPAPYQKLSKELLMKATYLTPNEIEVESLSKEVDVASLNEKLIITKGEHGVQYYANQIKKNVPSFQVDVKDTTGAGDTFNGVLAAQLAEGVPFEQAIKFANAAAALSITRLGAQGGMPTKKEVSAFIKASVDTQ